MTWFDNKPKYALITHVTEEGLIKLIDDLDRLYVKHRYWSQQVEMLIRKSKEFGPYQVNILHKDFDEMLLLKSERDFISRYRTDGDE